MDENNVNASTQAQKSNMGVILIAVVVLLLIGGGFYFFSTQNKQSTPTIQSQQESNAPTAAQPSESPSVTSGEVVTESTKESTVTGQNFSFTPSEIRVKKGEKIKLTFKNVGGVHDFVIDELGVRTNQISSGQSETVEFVADKTGAFEFYCSVGNHRQMGMKGNLIVE